MIKSRSRKKAEVTNRGIKDANFRSIRQSASLPGCCITEAERWKDRYTTVRVGRTGFLVLGRLGRFPRACSRLGSALQG